MTFKYLISNGLQVLTAVCLLVVLLFIGNQVVMAQEGAVAPERFTETDETLTLTLVPGETGNLSSGERLYIEPDGKVLWGYVGPEGRSDLDAHCNDIRDIWWPSDSNEEDGFIASIGARAVRAEAVKTEIDGEVSASLTLDLPSNATNDLRYCFRIPILTGGKQEADKPDAHLYIPYQLESAAPSVFRAHFEIGGSVPLPETNSLIPSSLIVRPLLPTDGLTDWQYSQIGDGDICGVTNTNAQFSDLVLNEEGLFELPLSIDMAGQHLCFRATNTDGEQVYESYKISQLEDVDSATTGESENDSSAWVVIVLIVVALGIVIYFIVRSK